MKTNYRLDDMLTKCLILMTENAKFEETIKRAGVHTLQDMRTYTSTDNVENKEENVLRHPMEMLNSLS